METVEINNEEVVVPNQKTMTKEEFSEATRKKAIAEGNLCGTETKLFIGERKNVNLKTSFNEKETIKNEATSNAIGISALLLKGSPKKQVNQEQLMNLLRLAYYLGAVNTSKELNFRFLHFYPENEPFDQDLAQGEAQIMLKGAWDAIRSNRIGSQVFMNVELEQIMQDMDLNNFIRMPKRGLRL